MSGGQGEPAPGGADPTMEDILASIRKILNEDEAATPPDTPAPAPYALTADMLLDDAPPVADAAPLAMAEPAPPPMAAPLAMAEPAPQPMAAPLAMAEPAPPPMAAAAMLAAPAPETPAAAPEPPALPTVANYPPAADLSALVAPAVAAAAAASLGSLARAVAAERHSPVHRGGPSIEDVVREELRPLLKAWLDTNLPPLVERLVRVEIERVVGRSLP